jgi:DNA-binding PadR family transcriptional regulator
MRKYYKLTERGEKETVNRLSELEDFIRNMQSLVNPKPFRILIKDAINSEQISTINETLVLNGLVYDDVKWNY